MHFYIMCHHIKTRILKRVYEARRFHPLGPVECIKFSRVFRGMLKISEAWKKRNNASKREKNGKSKFNKNLIKSFDIIISFSEFECWFEINGLQKTAIREHV